jgi:transposase
MIAGIDVNEREIVIAYFSDISNNGKPKFERIKRLNDKEVLLFLLNKLRMNKIDEVAIENPRRLLEDKLFNDIGMNIVSFLEKFRKLCEKMGIKVIFVNPRGTSKLCPKCNRKLKKLGSNFYFLYCKNCKLILDEDEVGSWNILNRGIEKIK